MTLTGSNSVGLHPLVKTDQEEGFLTGMLDIATFFLGSRNGLHKTCSTRAPYSVQQKNRDKYLGTATECQCVQAPPRQLHLQTHLSYVQALQSGWGTSRLKVLLRNFST